MSRAKSNQARYRPATTPDERENQLISLASDLAETQLRSGTASSQVVTHFLKLGSSRERLEQKRLEQENLLISAKIEQMASQDRIEGLYAQAMAAFGVYSGQEPELGYGDEYED